MDESLLRRLLNQGEGVALDFKETISSFEGSTDDEKSKLLKDIIAFCNAWRDGDAHILIGIRPAQDHGFELVGITEEPFDDAHLQQFVNSKLNREIRLSYCSYILNRHKIGIIKIPKQQRPVYSTVTYGKVVKEAVYYRRGSSTAIATPDQIASMGADDAVAQRIIPDLQFALGELETQTAVGLELEIISEITANGHLPEFKRGNPLKGTFARRNPAYWREMAAYIYMRRIFRPVSAVITNLSPAVVDDVRAEIIFACHQKPDLGLATQGDMSSRPQKTVRPAIPADNIFKRLRFGSNAPCEIVRRGDAAVLRLFFGKVQPQASIWLEESFYIGSLANHCWDATLTIYADTLPHPIRQNLRFNVRTTEAAPLTVASIEQWTADHPDDRTN